MKKRNAVCPQIQDKTAENEWEGRSNTVAGTESYIQGTQQAAFEAAELAPTKAASF